MIKEILKFIKCSPYLIFHNFGSFPCSFIRSWTPTSGTKLVKNSPPNMMRPKRHCTTRQEKNHHFWLFWNALEGIIFYPPFTSQSVKLSLWSELIILFLLKFTSCVDRTVRQKHKLALLHFIYLDFWMVVALTSSTVHDIEFKGFQLATWLALLLCFIHERWIWIWLFHGQIPKRY